MAGNTKKNYSVKFWNELLDGLKDGSIKLEDVKQYFPYDAKKPKGLSNEYGDAWQRYQWDVNREIKNANTPSGNNSTSSNSSVGSEENRNEWWSNKAKVASIDPSLNTGTTGSPESTPKQPTNANTKTKTNGNGSGYTTSGVIESLLKASNKSIEDADTKADNNTSKKASELGVNTKSGTYDNNGYISFDSMKRDINEAEKNVKNFENANKAYQDRKRRLDEYESLLEKLKTGTKKGWNSLDLSKLRETQSMLEERKTYLEGGLNFIEQHPEMFDDAWKERNAENLEDSRKRLEDIYGQAAVISKKIQEGEDWQNLIGEMGKFQKDFADTIGIELDEFGNYAQSSGSKVNQYQYETAKTVMERIDRALADGNITKEEIGDLAKLEKMVDDIGKNERSLDPNITDADERLENAKARRGYFIMDQIKSWIVFIMSMETGNPQMAYSALEMFNKKIADSEAGYRENRMKAFSNNEMKEITGDADAAYDMKQLRSELEKNKFFYGLKEDEKAQAVRQLEREFEEYRRYTSTGGKDDFAAWYTAKNMSGKGWPDVIISLIQAGALNAPSIIDYLKGLTNTESGQPESKEGSKDTSKPITFNLKGGRTSSLVGDTLASVGGASKEEQINKQRGLEKQNIVASIKGQSTGAPQTQPTGKVNGWGTHTA